MLNTLARCKVAYELPIQGYGSDERASNAIASELTCLSQSVYILKEAVYVWAAGSRSFSLCAALPFRRPLLVAGRLKQGFSVTVDVGTAVISTW